MLNNGFRTGNGFDHFRAFTRNMLKRPELAACVSRFPLRDDFKTGAQDEFHDEKENECGLDKKPTEGSNDELQYSDTAPECGG